MEGAVFAAFVVNGKARGKLPATDKGHIRVEGKKGQKGSPKEAQIL